jgi:hypothetical protein
MAFGPAAGLELVEELRAEPTLADYHLLPSVRGDLLARLGRRREAAVEFERAAALTRNARERQLLLERTAGCDPRRRDSMGLSAEVAPTALGHLDRQAGPQQQRADRHHPAQVEPGERERGSVSSGGRARRRRGRR